MAEEMTTWRRDSPGIIGSTWRDAEPHEMAFDEDELRRRAIEQLSPPQQPGQRLKEQKMIRLGQLLKRRALSPRQKAVQQLMAAPRPPMPVAQQPQWQQWG